MKKILYSLFALILCSTFATAQTTLMSDEEHRIMMNDYQVHLDSILNTVIPQGISIEQFKKKIVNGELTLSSSAQASILTYATPLITYGTQFATVKNLTAMTDAEKIFLSSFAPSTIIDENGNLVEETTTFGLISIEMWTCALNSFNTVNCDTNATVSNKSNINGLLKTFRPFLSQQSGYLCLLLMINEYGNCLDLYKEKSEVNDGIVIEHIQRNSQIAINLLNNITLNINELDIEYISRVNYGFIDFFVFEIPFKNDNNRRLSILNHKNSYFTTSIEILKQSNSNRIVTAKSLSGILLYKFDFIENGSYNHFEDYNFERIYTQEFISQNYTGRPKYNKMQDCGIYKFAKCMECGFDVCDQDIRCKTATYLVGPAFVVGLAITCKLRSLLNPR